MKSVYKLAIKALLGVCLFILTVGFLSVDPAHAVECSFQTSEAHYASTDSLAEELSFQWDKDSEKVNNLSWKHVSPENWRISFEADRGQVIRDGNYYSLNLGATTEKMSKSNPETRESLIGYLAPHDVSVLPEDYTFAAIQEGSSTFWFVAYGKVSPDDCILAR